MQRSVCRGKGVPLQMSVVIGHTAEICSIDMINDMLRPEQHFHEGHWLHTLGAQESN